MYDRIELEKPRKANSQQASTTKFTIPLRPSLAHFFAFAVIQRQLKKSRSKKENNIDEIHENFTTNEEILTLKMMNENLKVEASQRK